MHSELQMTSLYKQCHDEVSKVRFGKEKRDLNKRFT